MITVLKIPIYLKVETDDMDRSKVTRLAQQSVIPLLVKHWQSKGLAGIFPKELSRNVDAQLGDFNEWNLLTDVQAMDGK